MKAFFEAIQSLFVDFLFKPLDWLRALELDNWWLANIVSWTLMAICLKYIIYWCKQLTIHQKKQRRKPRYYGTLFLKVSRNRYLFYNTSYQNVVFLCFDKIFLWPLENYLQMK